MLEASRDPRLIAAYARRDWRRVREAKKRAWAEDARCRSPESALELSSMLWAHMRTIDPSWPDAAQRQSDLAHHLERAARLRRVNDALRR